VKEEVTVPVLSGVEAFRKAATRAPRGGTNGGNRRWANRLGRLWQQYQEQLRQMVAEEQRRADDEKKKQGMVRCKCGGWNSRYSSLCSSCGQWI